MIDVEVKHNLQLLTRRIRRLRAGVQGDLLNRVAQRTARHARDRIRTEHNSPDGEVWPPRRSGSRGGHPLMRKTGALLNSIRAARDSKTLINMGSDVPYAIFHHKGTARMARRQAVGVGPGDVQDLQSLIDAWVARRGF